MFSFNARSSLSKAQSTGRHVWNQEKRRAALAALAWVGMLAACGGSSGQNLLDPAADADAGGAGACDTACTSPPASACVDAKMLRTHVPQGTCGGGACTYARYDVQCANACLNGACVGSDACNGVTCVTPPAAACQDGATLKTYAAAGTCSAGACSYAGASTACGRGCKAGACVGDPCAGVMCAEPPSATCVTPGILRSYASAGTCAAGTCAYAPIDTTCLRPLAPTRSKRSLTR